MKRIILLFLFIIPLNCFSQFRITGKVLNILDHKPIGNVNVFLSNSSIGSKTSDEGEFSLQNVKPGKYDIIVSIIGYETLRENVIVNADVKLPDILIAQKTKQLSEVRIKSKNDENREDYLTWFKDEFLGRSTLASDCKILNPEILDLNYDEQTKTLTVSSPDFLEIDNPSLGYHLKYLLNDFKLVHKGDSLEMVHFDGWALFKEMSGSASTKRAWQRRRFADYEGSPMHFLRTLTIPQWTNEFPKFFQEGFWVMRLVTFSNPARPGDSVIRAKINYFKENEIPGHRDSLAKWKKIAAMPTILKKLYNDNLNTGEFVKRTDQKGIYALGLNRPSYSLFINYQKDRLKKAKNGKIDLSVQPIDNLASPKNTENTLVGFNNPFAFFDKNGQVFNVNSLEFSGVWARRRIADLLPTDYVPKTQ